MSAEFEFEIERYEGPEYPSLDHTCEICKRPLIVRLVERKGIKHASTDINRIVVHSFDGTQTVEALCSACWNAILLLDCEVENYNHTGDPTDCSWEDDESEDED